MNKDTKPARTYGVQSVERACFLLNRLKEGSEPVPLQELATVAGLHKSSAFRYLWTLELHGYVERNDDGGGYMLGRGFAEVRSGGRERLIRRCRLELEALRDAVNETTGLGILEGTTVLYLDVAESQRSMRFVGRPGERAHVHAASLGKAICSQLPESEVRSLLATAGMPKLTENTITDLEEFMDELDEVRRKGFSINAGESDPDLRSISVPLLDVALPAAISVVAPIGRMTGERIEEYVPLMKAAARRIATAS